MKKLLTLIKFPMYYLFIGVIFGGIPVLFRKADTKEKRKTDWLFFVIGFIIILVMTLYEVTIVNLANSTGILQFVFLFIAGIIIAVALILPGISTSFMLLAIGLYDTILDAINNLKPNYLIPIGLGTVFGILTTTKILERCMQKKPRQTYLMILGFVAGSVLQVFPGLPDKLYNTLKTGSAGFNTDILLSNC